MEYGGGGGEEGVYNDDVKWWLLMQSMDMQGIRESLLHFRRVETACRQWITS